MWKKVNKNKTTENTALGILANRVWAFPIKIAMYAGIWILAALFDSSLLIHTDPIRTKAEVKENREDAKYSYSVIHTVSSYLEEHKMSSDIFYSFCFRFQSI